MNRSKRLLLVGMLTLSCIIMQPNATKAALQSNGEEPVKKNVNDWITQIRQMQTPGGGLGLTDTIDETNLTSQNKNLDIHMQKNTEYGAIAILSASAYGNPSKIEDGDTTTGNNTGIVMNLNKEWVAAGLSDTAAVSMRNASGRYKNQYTSSYVAKVGDAVTETQGWHGENNSIWISVENNYQNPIVRACLLRSYYDSIFSYYGCAYGKGESIYGSDLPQWRRDADYRFTWASRAIVVVGSGV